MFSNIINFDNNKNKCISYLKREKFDFSLFKSVSGLNNINDSWLEWLIGLYEGDGTLIFREKKGFHFGIVSTHKATLDIIIKTLGFGKIRQFPKKENNLDKWSYYIEDRYNIYLILLLLNGNLVLNKRMGDYLKISEKFNNVKFKNKLYKYNIDIKYEQVLPSKNDGWFSGFVDAEGHFGCPIETKRTFIFRYISISFEVGQNGEMWFFKHLQRIFGGGILYPKNGNDLTHNRIIFKGSKKGKNNVMLVFSYFEKFPLITKLSSYKKWKFMHSCLINKEHLKKEKISKLLLLAKGINLKR